MLDSHPFAVTLRDAKKQGDLIVSTGEATANSAAKSPAMPAARPHQPQGQIGTRPAAPKKPAPDPNAALGPDRAFTLSYNPNARGWPKPYMAQTPAPAGTISAYGATVDEAIGALKDRIAATVQQKQEAIQRRADGLKKKAEDVTG